jgi:hypothetical protein
MMLAKVCRSRIRRDYHVCHAGSVATATRDLQATLIN